MSQFNNPNWIGFDGQPITGKVPPVAHITSDPPGMHLTPEQRGVVQHAFKLFCDAVAVSSFPDGFHVQHRDYPDGMKVRMESNGGQQRVFIHVVVGGEKEEDHSRFAWAFLNEPDYHVYSAPFNEADTPATYASYPYDDKDTAYLEYYAALIGDPKKWRGTAKHWSEYGELAPPVFGPHTTQGGLPGKGGGYTLSFGGPRSPGMIYIGWGVPAVYDTRPLMYVHAGLQSVGRPPGVTARSDAGVYPANVVAGASYVNGHMVAFVAEYTTGAGTTSRGRLRAYLVSSEGSTELPTTGAPDTGLTAGNKTWGGQAWNFSRDGTKALACGWERTTKSSTNPCALNRAQIAVNDAGVPESVTFTVDTSMAYYTAGAVDGFYGIGDEVMSSVECAGFDYLDREIVVFWQITKVASITDSGDPPEVHATPPTYVGETTSASRTHTCTLTWSSQHSIKVDEVLHTLCSGDATSSAFTTFTTPYVAISGPLRWYPQSLQLSGEKALNSTFVGISHFDLKSLRWIKRTVEEQRSSVCTPGPYVTVSTSTEWQLSEGSVLMTGTATSETLHSDSRDGSGTGTTWTNGPLSGALRITPGEVGAFPSACDGRWLLLGCTFGVGGKDVVPANIGIDLTRSSAAVTDLGPTPGGIYLPSYTIAMASVGPDWFIPKYMPFTE